MKHKYAFGFTKATFSFSIMIFTKITPFLVKIAKDSFTLKLRFVVNLISLQQQLAIS